MTEEENILKTIIEKESWEEIIYYIVSIENLDPWDVDLIKLAESFIHFIRNVEELDFRIPAKIVFVAAVLLKLKADRLSIFEEERKVEEVLKERPFVDLGIDPNLIQLGLPVKRVPKRQVTLDELIHALRKALAVRERREERIRLGKARIQAEIIFEEDISKRLENIMNEIEELMRKLRKDKIEFKEIVEDWNREEIVSHFVPLLHLERNEKIRTEQEDFFKEIYISVKESLK